MLKFYDIIFIISYIVIYSILYGITYKWIEHMEKTGCDCSNDWRKDFTKYYIIFTLSYNIISAFYLIFIGNNINIAFNVKVLITIVDIFFIINTYLYITKLKKEKCECSEGIFREITLIHTIISACLIFIAFSIIVFINFSLYISGRFSQETTS